jgi:hypothetical protein
MNLAISWQLKAIGYNTYSFSNGVWSKELVSKFGKGSIGH